jgi:hypothetical protein
MSEPSQHMAFMAWYGSTAVRRKLATHDDVHVRARALASLRQIGHDGMDHDEYKKLHSDHLMTTMKTGNLDARYSALVDSRITPEHLHVAVNQEYKTQQGKIFKLEAQKKLDKLNG